MKKPAFTALLVVMTVTCVITLTTSAPTSSPLTNNKAATSSPDTKSQDDTKKKAISLKNAKTGGTSEDTTVRKKKSEEFIQFGNQQNKPAGMVDDALSGIATKKNTDMKRQQSHDEVVGPRVEEDESGTENDPLSTLMMNEDKGELIPPDDNPFGNDRELEGESYASANGIRGVLPMESELQDDTQSAFRGLREQANIDRFHAGEWFGGVDEYGNRRRRRNVVRNDRNFRKRSLRTTAEQLMNMRGGSRRWKRDVRVREDDVLDFLSLLAAAELAKEQEDRQREVERLQELGFPWAPMLELEDDPAIEPSLYRYYYHPDQTVDPETFNKAIPAKETPDVFMMNSDEMSPMKRGFYPAVDYRSLGIIGAKKRRRQHPQISLTDLEDLDDDVHSVGSWGKIRENNRRNEPKFKQILGDYNSMEDDADNQESSESSENIEANNYGSHRSDSEKLYSLGELLNGNSEVEDYRYPVYRRLI